MPTNIQKYFVPLKPRKEVILAGDDNISAVLRRDSALACGFTFKENPGSSVHTFLPPSSLLLQAAKP